MYSLIFCVIRFDGVLIANTMTRIQSSNFCNRPLYTWVLVEIFRKQWYRRSLFNKFFSIFRNDVFCTKFFFDALFVV